MNSPMPSSYANLTREQLNYLEVHKRYYQTHDHLLSEQSVATLKHMIDMIHHNNTIGDIVQCGVWKGGSLLLLSNYLRGKRMQRRMWGYDTFAGFTGNTTMEKDTMVKPYLDHIYGSYPSLESVTAMLTSKGCLPVTLVKQDLSHPTVMLPNAISLLHVDVDLFEPTYGALTSLYDVVVSGGYIVIDDYNDDRVNCKEAVDAFILKREITTPLYRIDAQAVYFIKP